MRRRGEGCGAFVWAMYRIGVRLNGTGGRSGDGFFTSFRRRTGR
jgi:hypothetical protein